MDVVAARHVEVVRFFTVNLIGRHCYRELASLGHGVTSIESEIKHHLFELVGVNPHVPDIFCEGPNHGDIRSDNSFEHLAN